MQQRTLRLDETVAVVLDTLREICADHGIELEYVIRCKHAHVQQLLDLPIPRKWTALCERCRIQNPSPTLTKIFERTPMPVVVLEVKP